ncbi:MAG: amidohydrolase family protein, partial [Gemmataceae bacterium]|nr:amidohydrolase family protein [Gemmataceae bacterium]
KTWSSIAEYLAAFDGASAVNVATLVPNGNVRLEAMGLETRPPTEDELREMRRLVREGMEQGAVGLSSGLDYIPSLYASEAELASLCEEIAPFGGVYVTHMRRYDPDGVLASLDDVFGIGRSARCPVHVSHFNSRADLVLLKLDEADATFDLYCYLAGSSILGMYCLPPWVQEGGIDATVERLTKKETRQRLEEWFDEKRAHLATVRLSYIAAPGWKVHEGMTLPEASSGDVGDFLCELLIASRMAAGCVVPHRRRGEEDIIALMRDRRMLGGSDGIFTGSRPHPRGCGCFARYLGHHVRAGTWTLETAVHRLSGATARRFGLKDRGELRAGMAADAIVFDAARIADRSTYEDGGALAEGMAHVVVNGVPVLRDGERTEAMPGRGLRRG